MPNRRVTWLVTILLLGVVLVLAGCAPRQGGGEVTGQAGAGEIAVDLPALVIEYDADGNPSIGGVPLAELSVLPPTVVQQITFDSAFIQSMQDANISNVQVNNMTDGLTLYANGQEIPSIAWDKESLGALTNLLNGLGGDAMGIDTQALGKLVPLLTNLGFAAVLEFPPAEGSTAAPIYSDAAAASEMQAAADEFVGTVGTPPVINIPVYYDETGDWTVAGISADEWEALTGAPFTALQLNEDIVPALKNAGVSAMQVSSTADGLALTINGTELPYVDWSGGKLGSVVDLALAAGVLDSPEMDAEALTAVLNQLLPIITSSNVKINVFLD